MKKSFKKIIGGVFVAILILLLAVSFGVSVINKKQNRPTFIFGYALLWVKTGSMEPAIPERSYILVKKYDGQGVVTDDVITFVCKDSSSPVYNGTVTHRVTAVTADGYKTKGDNSAPDKWTVKEEDVVSKYVGNLPVLTFFGRVFSSSAGLILIAVVFLGSVCFIYVPDIIKALNDEDRQKEIKEKEIQKRIEEEIEKLRQNDLNDHKDDDL